MERVQRKSTADLDSGRRPELKTAEIFLWTLFITEIFAILVEIKRRFSDAYWDFESIAHHSLLSGSKLRHVRRNVWHDAGRMEQRWKQPAETAGDAAVGVAHR